jgi:uncharacterized membrane protein
MTLPDRLPSLHHGKVPGWRRERLASSLWFVPTLLVLAAIVLFAVTYALDRAVFHGTIAIPGWAHTGDANAARAILTGLAAAVITVVGVVFSITIVALTLASTQFGPRMLRNFVRDRTTQFTLGTFVATFVFCILALGSISEQGSRTFVPHISVVAALALVLIDLAVLIVFIQRIGASIQLPNLVYGIGRDLARAIDELDQEERAEARLGPVGDLRDAEDALARGGVEIPARTSGYLQGIGHDQIVRIASRSDAVVQLVHRPGDFVTAGRPLAVVAPAASAPGLDRALARAHVTGATRHMHQDVRFTIDQLVEIAIRALSPAVNDTFTAVTCIDWLGDGMCRLARIELPVGIVRDAGGRIRLIEVAYTFDGLLGSAFAKIRQAGRGMPAVTIRQLETLARIVPVCHTEPQRAAIRAEANKLLRTVEAVPDSADRADIEAAFDSVHAALGRSLPSSDGVRPQARVKL